MVMQQKDRQRRLVLALPVLVLPFLALFFWALGGGQASQAKENQLKGGFNAELPGANNKKDPQDKMEFYSLAEKDSLERLKQRSSDPYYDMSPPGTKPLEESSIEDMQNAPQLSEHLSTKAAPYDQNEARVYRKINELQSALRSSQEPPAMEKAREAIDPKLGGDIDRLEQLMGRLNTGAGGQDPEMKQIQGMLESIIDIQNPDRVQQRLKKASEVNRGNVFAVSAVVPADPVAMLSQGAQGAGAPLNGFYGLEDQAVQNSSPLNAAIRAVVHQTQVLVNGSTVKLRLIDPVYINGILIPKDQFINGQVNLSGERLKIEIKNIAFSNLVLPVNLTVYDLDGIAGVYVPGAIEREVAKQGSDRAVQGIGLTTFDPSLGAQAASAGVEISKSLFSRKVKLIKATIKAGHQVLLVNERPVKESNEY